MTKEKVVVPRTPNLVPSEGGAGAPSRTGLVFLPDRNSKAHDYSGAFDPESKAFAEMYKFPRVKVDISKGSGLRRATVLTSLGRNDGAPRLDCVAFFMHGLRRSLPQIGFDTTNTEALGAALANALSPTGVVVLYACSTAGGIGGGGARGENGFADVLRDAITRNKQGWTGHVDAHERAAHTTRNALVRRFFAGKLGGEWIIEPGTELFNAWKRNELHGTDEMRFRFPFMSIEDIRAETARDSEHKK